jgi:hypothetical protein
MFSVGVFCLQELEKIQSALASICSLVIVPQMSILSFLESHRFHPSSISYPIAEISQHLVQRCDDYFSISKLFVETF